ncbi:MAG: DMT family transporter [Gammaproteobacteria bacterium]|nr:MAG: DMT family transporter [Gammaproteobacteria bacterium]
MMSRASNYNIGYVSIFLCCVANAVSLVFISNLNKTHDQMLSIFMTFGYATLLFNLFNFKKIPSLYFSVAKNFKLLLKMNIVTLFNWLSSFLALSYIDPATAICVILGVVSVTIFVMSIPRRKAAENKHLAMCVFLILISMALIIKQYTSMNTLHANSNMAIVGITCCIISGVSGAFIGVSSESMGQAGFSVSQILATRFYLLVIVSGTIFFFSKSHASLVIDWKYYLLASLLIVFFPLIMYQTAIRTLGTLMVSLLEPFTPVITYFLQVLTGGYQFNLLTVILLAIASGSIIWLARAEQNVIIANYSSAKADS